MINWSRRFLSDIFLPKKYLKSSSFWEKDKLSYNLKHSCSGTHCCSRGDRALLHGFTWPEGSLLIHVTTGVELK